MLTVRTGVGSQEVLQGAQHVRSVATALHPYHPRYWFVIDRDDWDDEAVNASWANFPDPTKDNLLIWRRKELESYFLEPAWACNSRYRKHATTPVALQSWLAAEASKVLLLEAANRVLIAKRNRIKGCAGNLLAAKDVQGCTRDQVVEKLVASPLLASLASTTTSELAEIQVRTAFDEEVTKLSGGVNPLAWDQGRWRDLMPAKPRFRSMVNQWFEVPDQARGGKARLTGRDAERAVAVDLLKNHQDTMPADFSELKRILDNVT